MTDDHKPVPHIDPAHAKPKTRPPAPKAAHKAEPRPAPRAPIPSVVFKGEAAPSKGKIAAAVGVTLAAGALIGRGLFGVAGRMLRRGR